MIPDVLRGASPPSLALGFVLLHCEAQQLVQNPHRAPSALPELKSAFLWDAAVASSDHRVDLRWLCGVTCSPTANRKNHNCGRDTFDVLGESRAENGPVLHNCAAPRLRRVNMNRIINGFFEKEERGQPARKLHINKQPTAIGQAAAK